MVLIVGSRSMQIVGFSVDCKHQPTILYGCLIDERGLPMTLNRDPLSPLRPSQDYLMRRSLTSQVAAGTVAVSVLVLLATYFLGGFDGLTANGVAALIFGVFASFALGIGLMVAVFYSSRKYDD